MKFCNQTHILNNEPSSLYQDENKPPHLDISNSEKQSTLSFPE